MCRARLSLPQKRISRGPSANGDGFSAHGAAFANTVWLLQFGEQCTLGLIFLVAGHVSLKGLLGPAALQDEPAGAAP